MSQRSTPTRIYRCDVCGFSTERRWYLKDHLMTQHGRKKKEATAEAARSEWWLAPQYFRARNVVEEADEEE